MFRRIFWPFLLLLALWASSQAAVDLVTLPTREGTQLTIYNSEDITMVREHRLLTVKEGVNRIQFSWANTLIDPTSIEFRILDKQDKVDLVDTTFPAGHNDALQWNIKSQIAGKLPVEIRYFTSGITWAADYVGIANEDETKLSVTGYVRVTNNSGEQYDNAETRLVVGNINLVEKIADLARRPPPQLGVRGAIEAAENADPGRLMFGVGDNSDAGLVGHVTLDGRYFDLEKAKVVQKQGLSEYFLFTIEGREDIKDKEPKRAYRRRPSTYRWSRSTSSPIAPATRHSRSSTASERQAVGRRRQREEAPLDGEPGLSPCQRHRQAFLRIQEP